MSYTALVINTPLLPAKDGPAVYYAGSAWDKAGQVADAAAWQRFVEGVAQRVRQPVAVTVSAAR